MNICYTSFTFSYLAKARLMAWSFKRFHPSWYLIAVITDDIPTEVEFIIEKEDFDEVIWSKDLPVENFYRWIFKHNIVEACTAVKGPALKHIFDTHKPEKIIYIDPDIAIFNELSDVIELLDEYNIILTPHQLKYDDDNDDLSIRDNEIASLKFGIYNLGFLAVNNSLSSYNLATWWRNRLIDYCFDDIPNGLFTDQRWFDHVPVFFNKVKILKDPGYNVASWNLNHRKLNYNDKGELLVNGSLMRFYHFTKLGPLGETMTARYAKSNIEVYELWEWYKYVLVQKFHEFIPEKWWVYGVFTNGEEIKQDMRMIYRERKDLQQAFPNPFESDGYLQWFKKNIRK